MSRDIPVHTHRLAQQRRLPFVRPCQAALCTSLRVLLRAFLVNIVNPLPLLQKSAAEDAAQQKITTIVPRAPDSKPRPKLVPLSSVIQEVNRRELADETPEDEAGETTRTHARTHTHAHTLHTPFANPNALEETDRRP